MPVGERLVGLQMVQGTLYQCQAVLMPLGFWYPLQYCTAQKNEVFH